MNRAKEETQEYITIKEACAISGKTKQSITKWCKLGKVKCTENKEAKKGTPKWLIERDDFMRYLLELSKSGKTRLSAKKLKELKEVPQEELPQKEHVEEEVHAEYVVTPKAEELPEIPTTQDAIIHSHMTYTEAQTALKIEQARKVQRENKLAMQEYILKTDVKHNIATIFKVLFDSQRELIDKWHFDYNIDLNTIGKIRKNYNDHLRASFRKLLLKSGVTEEDDIENALSC